MLFFMTGAKKGGKPPCWNNFARHNPPASSTIHPPIFHGESRASADQIKQPANHQAKPHAHNMMSLMRCEHAARRRHAAHNDDDDDEPLRAASYLPIVASSSLGAALNRTVPPTSIIILLQKSSIVYIHSTKNQKCPYPTNSKPSDNPPESKHNPPVSPPPQHPPQPSSTPRNNKKNFARPNSPKKNSPNWKPNVPGDREHRTIKMWVICLIYWGMGCMDG